MVSVLDICPGSDIFFGKKGTLIYDQVMYCGDCLKFVVLQEILLKDRALLVSEKYPLTPLLQELFLRGKEEKSKSRAK